MKKMLTVFCCFFFIAASSAKAVDVDERPTSCLRTAAVFTTALAVVGLINMHDHPPSDQPPVLASIPTPTPVYTHEFPTEFCGKENPFMSRGGLNETITYSTRSRRTGGYLRPQVIVRPLSDQENLVLVSPLMAAMAQFRRLLISSEQVACDKLMAYYTRFLHKSTFDIFACKKGTDKVDKKHLKKAARQAAKSLLKSEGRKGSTRKKVEFCRRLSGILISQDVYLANYGSWSPGPWGTTRSISCQTGPWSDPRMPTTFVPIVSLIHWINHRNYSGGGDVYPQFHLNR